MEKDSNKRLKQSKDNPKQSGQRVKDNNENDETLYKFYN